MGAQSIPSLRQSIKLQHLAVPKMVTVDLKHWAAFFDKPGHTVRMASEKKRANSILAHDCPVLSSPWARCLLESFGVERQPADLFVARDVVLRIIPPTFMAGCLPNQTTSSPFRCLGLIHLDCECAACLQSLSGHSVARHVQPEDVCQGHSRALQLFCMLEF